MWDDSCYAPAHLLPGLGRRLREIRKRQGLTQRQVAEQCHLSTNYVSELERGLRNPSLTTLSRLAGAGLAVDLATLFSGMTHQPTAAAGDPRAVVEELQAVEGYGNAIARARDGAGLGSGYGHGVEQRRGKAEGPGEERGEGPGAEADSGRGDRAGSLEDLVGRMTRWERKRMRALLLARADTLDTAQS